MSQSKFIHFIFKDKQNRLLLLVAGVATIVQFSIFKFLYPFADFFSDSYSYLYGALANLDINIWPIGYSKFLRGIHELNHSDIFLVGFQYFFLELSCLYLFFSVKYFYQLGKASSNALFIFLFLNPLFLYISNYVNSDPLFAALSVLWICEIFWIINHPRIYRVFTQAILLFLCFTVRNNAYYYPFITTLAFILSKQSLRFKLVGIGVPIVLIGIFIIHTRNAAQEITGTKQFSLFTGWQLGNNALYMRGHVLHVDSAELPSIESRELDRLSRKFYLRVPADFDDYLSGYGANYFIRDPDAPLKQYFSKHYQSKDDAEEVASWGKASVVFEEYGKWLIKKYPLSYARYFMLMNMNNYFFPPLEKLEVYNLGNDEVERSAEDWFDYKTPVVTAISKTVQAGILYPFPYLFFFLNILTLGSGIWLLLNRKSLTLSKEHRTTLLVSSFFLIANFCFCVFATIIVMRYQFFPMIITLVLPILIIEVLERKPTITKKEVTSSTNNSINLNMAKT